MKKAAHCPILIGCRRISISELFFSFLVKKSSFLVIFSQFSVILQFLRCESSSNSRELQNYYEDLTGTNQGVKPRRSYGGVLPPNSRRGDRLRARRRAEQTLGFLANAWNLFFVRSVFKQRSEERGNGRTGGAAR